MNVLKHAYHNGEKVNNILDFVLYHSPTLPLPIPIITLCLACDLFSIYIPHIYHLFSTKW